MDSVVTMISPFTLVFSNVFAEFYGIDTPYALQLPCDFQLDGVLSYVRGKRRDIDDDLYRIAPVNGRTTITYQRDSWSLAIEGVYAGGQDKVSETNREIPSRAWGVMNLFATWEPFDGIVLDAGVDNVIDNYYARHLSGVSRVSSSGVAAGSPLPSPGRSFFGRISGRF
jgi:iron complex outermembrane receptor protein